MRKLSFAVLLVFLGCFSTFANDADLFKFDYNSVQHEFAELDQLADMVSAKEMTFTDLKSSNENLIVSMNLVPDMALPQSGEPVLGIPSFLWGCVLGVVGLVVVYVGTDQDKVETKKALWGCITSGAVTAVVYIIYWAVVINVATSAI